MTLFAIVILLAIVAVFCVTALQKRLFGTPYDIFLPADAPAVPKCRLIQVDLAAVNRDDPVRALKKVARWPHNPPWTVRFAVDPRTGKMQLRFRWNLEKKAWDPEHRVFKEARFFMTNSLANLRIRELVAVCDQIHRRYGGHGVKVNQVVLIPKGK